jgi:short subunit dehydrogenase-like uncharacterized protein
MAGRVILFGATGYTGRLTAECLVRAGAAPVLAGRSEDALVALVGELAPYGPIDAAPTWQWADVADAGSVRALVRDPADVLVSTVGPFDRLGRPAIEAAIDQGCAYLDSTGEPGFIRQVFEVDGPRAAATGARLLPAFGYDYVPGNLAGALAMRDARDAGRVPTRVEIGYFARGELALSSGTRASAASGILAPAYAFRHGRLGAGLGAVTSFEFDGRRHDALPVSTSEHFALPRIEPGLRDVGVYLGWAGRWTRATAIVGGALAAGSRLPLLGGLLSAGVERASGTATGQGPSAGQRAGTTTIAVARTFDGVGRELGHVRVEGPSPYDLTAELLAWGAAMQLTGRACAAGAQGPVDAFGLDALVDGCAAIGLRRVD